MAIKLDPMHLAEFMDLFAGNKQNYGEHIYKYTESEKENGKNATISNKLVTEEQYAAHLLGKKGLGIIPINEKNECSFGVIDIDAYTGMPDYPSTIDKHNMPLVPFRSKSGGLHIYLFVQAPIAASVMQQQLAEFAILLGIDLFVQQKLNKAVEFFPKQTKLTGKDIGNWINLPYYNAEDSKQHVITNGKRLSLPDALHYIKDEKRLMLSDVKGFLAEMPFSDGPPCLRTIFLLNVTGKDSGRNNYLFSVGTYLKKKDETFWERSLFEVNANMEAPLSADELENTVIKSLRKQDYNYKCFDTPMVNYCRRQICKTTKFGVGKEDGYFSDIEFGKMCQIKIQPPYYEWAVKSQGPDNKFVVLRFRTEDELIHQDTFQRLALRELHTLPVKIKQSEWAKIVNTAFADLDIKEVAHEDDTSYMTIFRTMFLDFLVHRAMANTRDQIVHKRVYKDVKKHLFYFRIEDLTTYLFITKNYKYLAPAELHGILRDIGTKEDRIRTESGKQMRVHSITEQDAAKLGETKETTFEAEFTEKEGEY